MLARCAHCNQSFEKLNRSQRYCGTICSNRSNRNNSNVVALPSTYSAELAEAFGILLGDGSLSKYFVKTYSNYHLETAYADFIKRLFEKLFPGASICRYDRPVRGAIEIQISSRSVAEYFVSIGFDARTRKIPSWISQERKYVAAAVRGLFDTEGSVGVKRFKGKHGDYIYKQLCVTNSNENVLQFLERSLVSLGFRPTRNSKKNIYISNKLDIKRYMEDIGSHNPKLKRKIES